MNEDMIYSNVCYKLKKYITCCKSVGINNCNEYNECNECQCNIHNMQICYKCITYKTLYNSDIINKYNFNIKINNYDIIKLLTFYSLLVFFLFSIIFYNNYYA
jgi:hypothetical protein